jgi:hypothetical protein
MALALARESRRDYLGEKISKRWKELAPRRRLAQLRGGPAGLSEDQHAYLVKWLLMQGYEMRKIRLHGLDDPIASPEERKQRLDAYKRRKPRTW